MKLLLQSAMCLGLAAAANIPMEAEASPSTLGLKTGWSIKGKSPKSHGLELIFAVKQQNVHKLESVLLAVSDPDSPKYGQHLSSKQVHAIVAPKKTSIEAVHRFLAEHGVAGTSVTPNSDFIRAGVTVEQAERMFPGAEYHELHHADVGYTIHRCMNYTLPDYVADAIDFAAPTVHIPTPKKAIQAKDSAPEVGNTPKHLRELYSVDVEGVAQNNSMAVTAFLNQHYHKADLNEFWTTYCEGITCGKGLPKLVGDATTGLRAGVESMLDIESITGVAGNVASEFWGFSGKSPDNRDNEPFMKWLVQMSNTTDADLPKLFSTSYGEDEKSWSLDAATRMNTEFMKAGARGVSLLYAAGDEGANCVGDKFVPETPGSSPYVTAVGGTEGSPKESAIGLSSGGFSSRWAMPSWQADAVKHYMSSAKDLPPASSGYNVSGRAYPDIAAQASDFTVVANLIPLPGVAGTSCASPTASGVIALLNDALLAAGKPTLGFLNPWIYKNAASWNDITSGSSNGCLGLGDGWPASAGWDAATGLGTPNYKKLVATLGL